ncbi:S8 family serine peptidase, partial [Candidatus Dojkabacteria bacterium]|nr:S8 family serine peptidase [Candidatus Dojkabacteria bacterium]
MLYKVAISNLGKSKRTFSKTLLQLVLVLSILVSPLSFSINPVKAAEPESYDDSKVYEKYSSIEEDLVNNTIGLLSDSLKIQDSPQTTEEFENSFTTFSFKANSDEAFAGASFILTHENGETSDRYVIEQEEEWASEEVEQPENEYYSILYIFNDPIKKVEIFHDEDYTFEVLSVDSEEASQQIETKSKISATAEEVAATLVHKNQFLNNLGLNIIKREEWGAPTLSTWEDPEITDINTIVVHHTVTPTTNPSSVVKSIHDYHAYTLGWLDIGYNYVIDTYGNIYEGRAGGNGVRGAHSVPNSNTIGIAILGNYENQSPTSQSKLALTKLIDTLSKVNNFDLVWGSSVVGHKDRNSTACPGGKLYPQLSGIVNNANNAEYVNTIVSQMSRNRQEMLVSGEFVKKGNQTELIVKKNSISDTIAFKLSQIARGYENEVNVTDDYLYIGIEESFVDQYLGENLTASVPVQPNFIYRLESWDTATDPTKAIPDDYDETIHWNLEKTNMTEAWDDLGCPGGADCEGDSNVVVAVLDTGVAYEDFDLDVGGTYTTSKHSGLWIDTPAAAPNGTYNEGYDRQYFQSPELATVTFTDPYNPGWELLCDISSIEGSSDACVDNPANPDSNIYHANDDNGHGTFVTTIIAGDTANDVASNNVVGMANNVQIMPVKVMLPNDRSMCQDVDGELDTTCGYANGDYRSVGTTTTIVAGIEHAVHNGADVINMSLRGEGNDSAMEAAVDAAVEAGVIVVVSAGNDGDDIANYFPASFDNVIAVGASDTDDTRSSYSNYGDELDIVAPVGTTIASRTLNCYPSENDCSNEASLDFSVFSSESTPKTSSGTSFAAPQVSAAVALIESQDSTLTKTEMFNLIMGTAQTLGGGFNTSTGYGLLDVEAALANIDDIPTPEDDPYSDHTKYFTWYDTSRSSRKAWILIGNPSGTRTANVNIKIANIINQNFTIPPGGRITPAYNGIQDGPVVISSDIEVYASQRADYDDSFNEYAAISADELSTKYYFTWYDTSRSNRKSWILVGNPSASQTANISITINGVGTYYYNIPPGGKVTPAYNNVQNGPVIINSNIPVYASQRSDYEGSFNEYAGIPQESLTNKYYFTWYDTSRSDRKSWILIGNPSSSQTATVNLYVPGVTNSTYYIPPGGRITPAFNNVINGPATITSNIDVYATQRSQYKGSFNEYPGISDSTLTTSNYFTWYDT